jgi:pimeloyl-ACP methyl ester carboxylesterase|tara:strand:- start:916 stop:2070 length:1155 start_codon:yes stop_codon:yes gene_type:complete
MHAIRPFKLEIKEEEIKDLNSRLLNTRLPDQGPGEPWKTGTDLEWFKKLLEFWKKDFDWKNSENKLNAFPQFKTQISDIDVHFLHCEGKGKKNIPLLLMHGWPGSVFEFLDIIPILTNPKSFGIESDIAFTVIAPSLPGFGLSFEPFQKRYGVEEIADCLKKLMVNVLEYEKFCIQGGDWGAMIGSRISYIYPDNILGLHLNMLALIRDYNADHILLPEEKNYVNQIKKWKPEGMGYQAIQGSRPQTLAYALTDSPSGLAAWICEKFYEWTDCNGVPENSISFDKMLANICLYWFSGAIGSSFWPYYARNRRPWFVPAGEKIEVPVGYCEFPKEMLRPERKLAEKTYIDIKRWSKMRQGGHFAALENSEVLAKEMFIFFNLLKL